MGANGTEREGPRFAALEHIEHPELHEESFIEARFNGNVYVLPLLLSPCPSLSLSPFTHTYPFRRKIMQVAGVHDFAFTRDIHSPQKQRLKVHLSALINLVLYRLTKLAAFSEKASEAVCGKS